MKRGRPFEVDKKKDSLKASNKMHYFYRCGTQLELEEALAGWLRGKIAQIQQRLANSTDPLLEERVEFSKLAET
jgi:hypothetical protein